MKLSTLRDWFRHQAKQTKLYVIGGQAPAQFLLAGFASHPREEGDAVRIDVKPYVVYSFTRDVVLKPGSAYIGLRLDLGSRITRKFQTHRRNVEKLPEARGVRHLEEYFEAAWTLQQQK